MNRWSYQKVFMTEWIEWEDAMLRSENEIRTGMIQSLKAQIEAVETDDEAQYIVNNAKQSVYAYVLRMNEYGRDLKKE